MHQSTGNKLENWIKTKFANQTNVMNVLQEYGIISDNCVNVQDVGNNTEAMMWIARNFERMDKHFGLSSK